MDEMLLGRQVPYPTRYTPSLLYPIDRKANRDAWHLGSDFDGSDTWHAHEAGFITRAGLPVTGMLKIVYPASSPLLVESKSLKLYLHSLNMTPLGDDRIGGIEQFTRTVSDDIGELLQTPVAARFFEEEELAGNRPFDFADHVILERLPEVARASFTACPENPSLLHAGALPGKEIKVGSHLLRGNCKVTLQPDCGSIYIHLKAARVPSPVALVHYIVSLRNEYHFHEETCEIVYRRLQEAFAPEVLSVTCLYARRGGIDICPSRANAPEFLPRYLHDPSVCSRKTFRQ